MNGGAREHASTSRVRIFFMEPESVKGYLEGKGTSFAKNEFLREE